MDKAERTMNITPLNDQVSVSEQIHSEDLAALKAEGVAIIICNRPDQEAAEQPDFASIAEAAEALGMEAVHIPFSGSDMTDQQVAEFKNLLASQQRIHAYCRTGNRSTQIFKRASADEVETGIADAPKTTVHDAVAKYDVVIIGAGSAGISIAASLLKRRTLRIAIIDGAKVHYYQPGWTLVGGGAMDIASTAKATAAVIPNGVIWLAEHAAAIDPDHQQVQLASGARVHYEQLVVAPGLELHWGGIEGLTETLGKNGVTSNYSFDTAPYTFELIKQWRGGKALFTQPPMPIKCAGAPQKIMYLAADYWLKQGLLSQSQIQFCNAGAVLFGVKDYLPALESYVERYKIALKFQQTLTRVDGATKTAWFDRVAPDGTHETVAEQFDLLHVCPPQRAPQFIRESALADDKGWLAVNPQTLQHTQYPNIWGAGDVINAPNAKTMAAARKQAPVVASNLLCALDDLPANTQYDGYGSCPLTVEHGKIVLAEFAYGGKLAPSFPDWLLKGTEPSTLAWWLKKSILPPFYWHGMLKGHEWLARPQPYHE